jgi:hypothetical protein
MLGDLGLIRLPVIMFAMPFLSTLLLLLMYVIVDAAAADYH